MGMLRKSESLYERNAEGNLIPQKRKLSLSEKDKKDYPELIEVEVLITPMPRGELKELFAAAGENPELDSYRSCGNTPWPVKALFKAL